mmetsp:Transcript_25853/g.67781  ORF Transcript_25853/g.67781 Transcript_25853/m.67781 type:complete len:716 (-) Transcript_25853:359-2506(-)
MAALISHGSSQGTSVANSLGNSLAVRATSTERDLKWNGFGHSIPFASSTVMVDSEPSVEGLSRALFELRHQGDPRGLLLRDRNQRSPRWGPDGASCVGASPITSATTSATSPMRSFSPTLRSVQMPTRAVRSRQFRPKITRETSPIAYRVATRGSLESHVTTTVPTSPMRGAGPVLPTYDEVDRGTENRSGLLHRLVHDLEAQIERAPGQRGETIEEGRDLQAKERQELCSRVLAIEREVMSLKGEQGVLSQKTTEQDVNMKTALNEVKEKTDAALAGALGKLERESSDVGTLLLESREWQRVERIELRSTVQAVSELRDSHEQLREECGTRDATEQLRESQADLGRAVSELRDALGDLSKAHGELKDSHGGLSNSFGELQEWCRELRSSNGALRDANGCVSSTLGDLGLKLTDLREELMFKMSDLENIKSTLDMTTDSTTLLETAVANLQSARLDDIASLQRTASEHDFEMFKASINSGMNELHEARETMRLETSELESHVVHLEDLFNIELAELNRRLAASLKLFEEKQEPGPSIERALEELQSAYHSDFDELSSTLTDNLRADLQSAYHHDFEALSSGLAAELRAELQALRAGIAEEIRAAGAVDVPENFEGLCQTVRDIADIVQIQGEDIDRLKHVPVDISVSNMIGMKSSHDHAGEVVVEEAAVLAPSFTDMELPELPPTEVDNSGPLPPMNSPLRFRSRLAQWELQQRS